jgi:hypothetical protein
MDFRQLYSSGVLARTDATHLYDLERQKQVQDTLVSVSPGVLPFSHAAHEALIFIPFSFLRYNNAYFCMLIFNALLLIPCFLLLRDAFSISIDMWQPRPGLVFFIYLPVTITLAQGQDSILLLLICCLTWHELRHARYFSAGCILAFALFKPHLVLILVFLLFLNYGWRFLGGFATGGAAVATACLSIVGMRGIKSFFELLRTTSLVDGQSEMAQAAVGAFPQAMPNLRGLFYALGGHHLPSAIAFSLVALLSLGLLGWAAYWVRRESEEDAFALSICVTVLLSYNIQIADLTILLLPVVLLAARSPRFLSTCVSSLFLLPLVLLLFLPKVASAPSFFLVSLPVFALTFVAVYAQPLRNDRENNS